ncbi:uncharacterized protein J8A68_002040 [[Candida] subhashii]|uniref:Zn(2)-C6 fungal-type domain-containing protein n=1 Tax=[Candida] subhashii TaxID=561895 RepID=A0A8J5QJW5_9ASCO|nr:uncharacterized protein J8A68_002040 [[Candida] subhashii]KAG7664437.1 hypothetical protein J8A68_002040 [[Candida] subhashii]
MAKRGTNQTTREGNLFAPTSSPMKNILVRENSAIFNSSMSNTFGRLSDSRLQNDSSMATPPKKNPIKIVNEQELSRACPGGTKIAPAINEGHDITRSFHDGIVFPLIFPKRSATDTPIQSKYPLNDSGISLIRSSPMIPRVNSTEIEIDRALLTSECSNEHDILHVQNIYRNLYGESPNASTNSSVYDGQSKMNSLASTTESSRNSYLSLHLLNQRTRRSYPNILNDLDPSEHIHAKPTAGNAKNKEEILFKIDKEVKKKAPELKTYNVVLKLKRRDKLLSSESKSHTTTDSSTGSTKSSSSAFGMKRIVYPNSDTECAPKIEQLIYKKRANSYDVNYNHEKKRKLGARSKTGCWTCRVRHKACPEEKPECSQCKRLQLFCDYSVTRPPYMYEPTLQERKLKEIRMITTQYKKTTVRRKKREER